MAMGVILGCTLFVVGADGVSAVLGYACAVVVFVLGALMIRRDRGGGG